MHRNHPHCYQSKTGSLRRQSPSCTPPALPAPPANGKPGKSKLRASASCMQHTGSGRRDAERPRGRQRYSSLTSVRVVPEPASESVDGTNDVVDCPSPADSFAAAARTAALAVSAATRSGRTERPARSKLLSANLHHASARGRIASPGRIVQSYISPTSCGRENWASGSTGSGSAGMPARSRSRCSPFTRRFGGHSQTGFWASGRTTLAENGRANTSVYISH